MWPNVSYGSNNLGSVLGQLGMNLGLGGMGYPALNMPPPSAPGTPNTGGATPGAVGVYNGLPRTTIGPAGSSMGYSALTGQTSLPPTAPPTTAPPTQNPQPFGNIGAGLGYPAYGMPASAPPPVLPGGAPAMFGPSTFPPPTRSVAGPTISARPGAAVTRGVSGSSVSGAIPPTARAQAPASNFGTVQYGVQRAQPITTALMLNRLFGR